MAKQSPESGRHNPELFNFSPDAEARIAAIIASLNTRPVSDEAIASLNETLPLNADQLIARVRAQIAAEESSS